jgi:negative regulator of flagellin synthesis FlgM
VDNRTPERQPSDPETRHDLVERIRREIAAGAYETPQKWHLALERLLERLQEE